MAYTILFVIILICVSGFIAYLGDMIGRRMGKKRLTLFNLRPRHTAIVVTTITGMLISTLVLCGALSMNAEFRKGFFQYGQILRSRRMLARENGRLALRGKQLKVQVAKQQKELANAFKDAKLAKKQRDAARQRVDGLRREIATRQKELIDLRKRRDITEDELSQRKDELKLMLTQLETAEQSLRLAQSKLAETEQKLGVTEARLKDTQDKLAEATQAFTEFGKLSDTAADYLLNMRLNEIAFRQGDELVRGIIKPSRSNIALRSEVHALLEQASTKALESGAKVGASGRAVNLRYRQLADKTHALFIEDEAICVGMAADKIATSDSDVLVQVVCGMNTLPSEQVPVELRLYVNELVFEKDGKIAETKIDGRQSEGHILIALSSFLQIDAAKTAARAGVVPVSGQDPRTFLGPDRPAQTDELLRTVAKIKSMGAVTNVSVYANDDIRASDSLNMDNIRFSVEKAE